MNLTNYEKKVLYGISRYPMIKDRELALHLGLKQSTVAAIRKRLKEEDYYRYAAVPMLNAMGAEILAVTYTTFNPVISLERRIDITEKKIETSEEIIFSIGEEDKGFSISISRNYTDIGRINDIRTKTFGELGLLEKEYPQVVVFPFEISKIYRFFDFSFSLKKLFSISEDIDDRKFFDRGEIKLSKNEKIVLCHICEKPELTSKMLSNETGLTRHTVGKIKKKFAENGYIKTLLIPNIVKLGFAILAFYHIEFDPYNPPDFEEDEAVELLSDDAIFFASREFEAILIAIHSSYEDYKLGRTRILQKLKEREWIASNPSIRAYSLNKSVLIKDINLAPITKKLLGCQPNAGVAKRKRRRA